MWWLVRGGPLGSHRGLSGGDMMETNAHSSALQEPARVDTSGFSTSFSPTHCIRFQNVFSASWVVHVKRQITFQALNSFLRWRGSIATVPCQLRDSLQFFLREGNFCNFVTFFLDDFVSKREQFLQSNVVLKSAQLIRRSPRLNPVTNIQIILLDFT